MTYNEAEMMKDFLDANKVEYNFSTLIKKIITKEPDWIHDFPCIAIYRSGASEELVLGDSFDSDGRGKFEPCTIMLGIYTQNNIARSDDSGITFLKNEDLVRRIREKLIKLFFDKRDYENANQPLLKFNMMLVSSDVEGMGITARGGTYMITMSIDVTASIHS